MKKVLHLLLTVFILGMPALAASPVESTILNSRVSLISSDIQAVSLEFELSDLERREFVHEGVTFDYNMIPGEGTTYEYGKPVLPAISRFVVVAPEAGLELEITAGETRRIEVQRPPMLCLDEGLLNGMQVFDDQPGEGIYPSVLAEMSDPIVIRGVRLVKITTYPVRYDFQTDTYLHTEHIQAEVRYTDDPPVNPATHPVRRNRSPQFKKLMQGLAINGGDIGRDDPDQVENEYVGHYLIVTHPSCLQYAGEFIEWRRKSGWKVDILSLTGGQAGASGTVKSLIQDRYDAYLEDDIDPFDHILLIGDRSNYDNGGGNGNWILEADRGNTVWGNINHADYMYACLEGGGNDRNPDVAISRLCSGSADQMGLAIGRTMAYEAEPDMDDTEWFTRAAVYSQHWGNTPTSAWDITVHTNVRWAEEMLQNKGFDDITYYEYYPHDQQGARIGPIIRDLYNEGVNLLLGRAENYFWRQNFNGVNDNTVFPIRVVTSGHGEWCAWSSFRAYGGGGANHLRGPVATTCGWGGPATIAMSAMWVDMANGLVNRGLTLGWARTLAMNAIELYFDNFQFRNQPVYLHTRTDVDCYGDPGIRPWLGVPRIVEADHPSSISPETRAVDIYVFDADNEDDVAGARVTLYVPGDMPDYDENDYDDYDEMQMWTKKTDEEGIARFVLDEDVEFEEGDMFVTVTGDDIRPYFGEIDIDRPNSGVEVVSYELTEVEGNEDDILNPGETLTIGIFAKNVGDRDAVEDVTGVVRSLSPWIEVDENEISFGDIDDGDIAEGDDVVTIHVDPACPDGESRPLTRPQLEVEFTDGEETWISVILLMPEAPNFIVSRIIGGEIIDGEENDIDIEITNVGAMDSSPLTAELVSAGIEVSTIVEDGRYPAVPSNRNARLAGDDFAVTGNQIVVPGTKGEMLLILTNEDGFIDTAYFDLQVGSPRANAPQGPDAYGYICFDDTDQAWDIAPEYDWIEISTEERDRDYNGTECDFEGESDFNVGEAQVVDLGFTTQFYGRDYTQITICTNGYISMGDQPRITNFQNWPMDRAMAGGAGMIAPLWDWLKFDGNQDSQIYYYFDEDESRFIVEWYNLRHRTGGNQNLTFQVIIYDKDVWVTETGDPNILIQYKTVSDVRGESTPDSRIPYASVGISSPDGITGINYRFGNSSPVTSGPFTDRRALLFATSPKFKSGVIYGWVTDAETDEPLSGASVATEHGVGQRTDENGYYRLPNALAEIEFDITARLPAYNDSMLTIPDTLLLEDDSLEISFALLHPEFRSSHDELGEILDVDMSTELEFTITNDGNGPLEWEVTRRLPDNADVDPWVQRLGHHVGEIVEDDRLMGVTYIDDHFYVSGANKMGRDDGLNLIYKMTRDMALVDSFEQFGNSTYGIPDLAWDGERLMYGAEDEIIYGFTPDGDLETEFEGPYNPSSVITWDSDREFLWISWRTASRLIAYDIDGNRVDTLMNRGFRLYGLAYWPDDPDGYNLYIFHNVGLQQTVHKMNTETNDTMHVATLIPEEGGQPQGAYITNEFDVYSWVFMNVTGNGNDDGGDRVDIWQLDARREWFRLEPNAGGTIDAEQELDFRLTLDATGLPPVLFRGYLQFFHNARGAESRIDIALDVQPGAGVPAERTLDLRGGWNMVSLNVDPNDNDIENMMIPLVEEDLLILMKNDRGHFYRPGVFNNIEGWAYPDGYQMYLAGPAQLSIRGIVVSPDQPIALEEGWSMKAYFPHEPLNPVVAVGSIHDELIIVKDVDGHFYLPEYDFSNMADMREGQGYQFKVSEDVELIYRAGERGAAVAEPVKRPVHFKVSTGGDNMSLLTIGDKTMQGWELGVFDGRGVLTGSGVLDDDGRCGVAVWGDNPATDAVEGAVDGSVLIFRLWDGKQEVPVLFESLSGAPVWSADGVTAGRISIGQSIPAQFGLYGAYPNPANGPVRLHFGLEEGAHTTLKVFDLSGREVTTLINKHVQTGSHQVIWNTDPIPSGLYLVRLESASRVNTRKVAVVK